MSDYVNKRFNLVPSCDNCRFYIKKFKGCGKKCLIKSGVVDKLPKTNVCGYWKVKEVLKIRDVNDDTVLNLCPVKLKKGFKKFDKRYGGDYQI